MPVVPSFLERLLLLRLNVAPAPLLDVFGAGALRAADAALELGLFAALAPSPLTSDELAHSVHASPRATAALLEVLRGAGYVELRSGRWRNSAMTKKWLVEPATSTANVLRNWSGVLFDLWDGLADTVRTGTPRTDFNTWLAERPERWGIFNAAMVEIARSGADELAAKVPLPHGASRILDVGGNHAINAIAFAKRYPGLQATVFDLSSALGDARARVQAAGLAERIQFVAGDFAYDDLGSGFDAALLFNVVHYADDDRAQALLAKVHEALAPRGIVAILEQVPEAAPSPSIKTFIAIFDLLCVTAMGGGVRSYREIASLLTAVGFTEARRIGLRKTPASVLIVATRG